MQLKAVGIMLGGDDLPQTAVGSRKFVKTYHICTYLCRSACCRGKLLVSVCFQQEYSVLDKKFLQVASLLEHCSASFQSSRLLSAELKQVPFKTYPDCIFLVFPESPDTYCPWVASEPNQSLFMRNRNVCHILQNAVHVLIFCIVGAWLQYLTEMCISFPWRTDCLTGIKGRFMLRI